MPSKKILILLPDGVGLRNFAYSNFYNLGIQNGFEVVFWNNTSFALSDIGFPEIKIKNSKNNPWTDIYKNAKIQIELNQSKQKWKEKVYDLYRFPLPFHSWKSAIKSSIVKSIVITHNSNSGLQKLRHKMKAEERKTNYYQNCLETLKKEKPAMVFCTNQRPVLAIAPLVAAQDLGIPTATFIFSWDNLPKATMVVQTDFYFVWSAHMKSELLHYYPDIKEEQVLITGTPQFESHFGIGNLLSREQFYEQNGLDIHKKYICYSGDDITTCPDDPQYLEDVAAAIQELNNSGHSLGILFRRCPVDFSSRYDEVLNRYRDIIVPVAPKWIPKGEYWNDILPTKEDVYLQKNTIIHTEMVVNLGSSMVFDYVTHKKPCAYINYDVPNKRKADWSVKNIYQFIHFRSMPNKNAVVWLDSKEEIAIKIKEALTNSDKQISAAQDWFEKINQHPPQNASERIWKQIKNCIVSQN